MIGSAFRATHIATSAMPTKRAARSAGDAVHRRLAGWDVAASLWAGSSAGWSARGGAIADRVTTGLTRDSRPGPDTPSPTVARPESPRSRLPSIGARRERPGRPDVALRERAAVLTARGRRARRAAVAFDVVPISIPDAVAAVSASTMMPLDAGSGTGEAPEATGDGDDGGVGSAGADELADVGVAGAGSDAGGDAGGASGAGGGWEAPRGGRSESGSTYVSVEPSRTPRWTYGTGCSASPVGPGSATTSPSATVAPRRTRSVPRCVSETLYSPNEIVTVRPFVGTDPAKVTSPVAGARIAGALPSATSMPLCCPAAYASSLTEKPRSTGPSTGQDQAHAEEPETSAHPTATPRLAHHLPMRRVVVRRANMQSTVPSAGASGNAR